MALMYVLMGEKYLFDSDLNIGQLKGASNQMLGPEKYQGSGNGTIGEIQTWESNYHEKI